MSHEYLARVIVTFKKGVPDGEGKGALNGLREAGFNGESAKSGKVIDLTITADYNNKARRTAIAASKTLLARPAIEEFKVSVRKVK